MARKNVNILLKLEDQFTGKMVKAGKITKEQSRAMNKCTSSVMGFSRSVRSGFTSAIGHVARFGAALTGIGGLLSIAGIKSFCETAIEGFNAATEAETKLEAVLMNVPSIMAQGAGAATAAKDRLVELADSLEEVGVVAGDVTTAGLQQLATFQLTEESLKKLTPGMADLIAQQKGINASQEDAIGYANLLGKAMTGQTGALSRAGIIMTDYQAQVMKTGTEEQRAAMLAEILAANVGGVNEALAQTDAGKIAQTQNLLGRAQDEIGGKLMKLKAEIYGFAAQYIPALQNAAMKAIDMIAPKIEAAMTWIAEHTDDIKAGVLRVKDGVAAAWKFIQPVLGFAIKHANTLIPAILGVVGAVSALSIAVDIATKISAVASAAKTAKIALAGFGAVAKAAAVNQIAGIAASTQLVGVFGTMKLALVSLGGAMKTFFLSPVGIIALIAAAVAAVIYLWNHCEGFRNFVKKAASVIAAAFVKVRDTVINVKDKIVTAFTTLKTTITAIFEAIRVKVKAVLDWIEQKIEAVKRAIDAIKQTWQDLQQGSWLGTNETGYASKVEYGHATGTPYFAGGLTRINEGGRGEIVTLPSGTQIIPHDVSEKAVGGNSYVFNFTIQGNVIGNRQYMEETCRYMTTRIKTALATV